MSTAKFNRPKLPNNIYVWFEPPDSSGDEVLHFVSERKRIKLKGHSFREFQQLVIPLLDGQHTLQEIEQSVADVFAPEDLEAGLQLLATHNLIEDADQGGEPFSFGEELMPQLNFFHELSMHSGEMQARLSNAVVTVIGMSGAGASAALSLAASQVGTLRCVDALPVAAADHYLSPVFVPKDVGKGRAQLVAKKIKTVAPQVKVSSHVEPLKTDDDVIAAIEGSDFVINCLDAGQSSLIYKLNRACLKTGTRWTSCALSGVEVVLGPTIHPYETPCYLCYKMRSVACAANPEDEFAFESFLDARKQDDSGKRESLVFGANIAANLLGLEAIKELSGVLQANALGKIIVFNLLDLTSTRHVVLRKPWCPACFKLADAGAAAQRPQQETTGGAGGAAHD
ncbi:MAG TPA: TOMM precursor leader peptide-binding protein [Pyrinomonadaceae bacterium]|nr:TOMM precursor leader peptide-binding protein [Pyrinomonadaceae bacterium]